jgi:hypothetical protein
MKNPSQSPHGSKGAPFSSQRRSPSRALRFPQPLRFPQQPRWQPLAPIQSSG